jgi:hypothetical protein
MDVADIVMSFECPYDQPEGDLLPFAASDRGAERRAVIGCFPQARAPAPGGVPHSTTTLAPAA